jgi:hypothetical protein
MRTLPPDLMDGLLVYRAAGPPTLTTLDPIMHPSTSKQSTSLLTEDRHHRRLLSVTYQLPAQDTSLSSTFSHTDN